MILDHLPLEPLNYSMSGLSAVAEMIGVQPHSPQDRQPHGRKQHSHGHHSGHDHSHHHHGHDHKHSHHHHNHHRPNKLLTNSLLPLPVSSPANDRTFSFKKVNITVIVSSYIRAIVSDRNTRNVFFFLLLNLSFMFVEIFYGWWSNSLGLIGDGVHMLFDSTALILSLVASVISKWDANERFSYGYGRVEILTGFLNCAALFFAAGTIVFEAIERLFEPQDIKGEKLFLISVLGLLVNIVGIFAFDHGGMHHHHHHHDHAHHDCGHGMFLHILADALGSVGVIISSLAIQLFGWQWADPVCSIFIAGLIFVSIWPLFQRSGAALLQRTPYSLDGKLSILRQKITQLPGALAITDAHIWEQASDQFVGTFQVLVKKDVDEQSTKQKINQLVAEELPQIRWFVIQIDKDAA